jgi:hypothetical protein
MQQDQCCQVSHVVVHRGRLTAMSLISLNDISTFVKHTSAGSLTGSRANGRGERFPGLTGDGAIVDMPGLVAEAQWEGKNRAPMLK